MTEQEKPDAIVRVNDFDVTLYRRGRGLLIRVQKDETEIGFFGIATSSPASVPQQAELASAPATIEQITASPAAASSPDSRTSPEAKAPLKVVGIVEAIEGMGETPNTHDLIFRFSVRWTSTKTNLEEVRQVAAFRQIAQTLNQFYTSPDTNIRLQPGRPISMIAWEHGESASLYPSQVNYLTFPAITNPKRR